MRAVWARPAGAVAMAAIASMGCNSLAGIDEPLDRTYGGDGSADAGADEGAPSADGGGSATEGAVDGVAADAHQDDDAIDAVDARVIDAVDARVIDAVDARAPDAAKDGGVVPPPLDAAPTSIQFLGSWVGSEKNVSQMSIHAPPSVHERDFLWLALYTDYRSTSVTPAPGWILQTERPNSAHDFHTWWFYKIATANEPAEYMFSFNQNSAMTTAAALAYSGVDTAAPFDRGAAFDTHLSPCVAPAIASTASGLLFVVSFLSDSAYQWAPLDPMNVRANYEGVFVADFPQLADGGTVDKAVGCTPAGDGAVMVMGLRPGRP